MAPTMSNKLGYYPTNQPTSHNAGRRGPWNTRPMKQKHYIPRRQRPYDPVAPQTPPISPTPQIPLTPPPIDVKALINRYLRAGITTTDIKRVGEQLKTESVPKSIGQNNRGDEHGQKKLNHENLPPPRRWIPLQNLNASMTMLAYRVYSITPEQMGEVPANQRAALRRLQFQIKSGGPLPLYK